ncbi:hypothetical protein H257_13404 [Aphanomyces astaci]|uniref:Uncharacterized protein n=1 Tax=Aphanomyces astaci TaxID=112090 RepID=W4FWE9_APHAT|nr:hypothetical protein H257_13404 [Aphanomyces astaci]ETV71266.1 hypothetical protein H257_13404 [Aphanomyces astaci]|eukprot:XP_009839206.1 hypothetical protein H257_13404 [Aphanomyces astaci]
MDQADQCTLEHNHLFHTSYEKVVVPVAFKVKRCLFGDNDDNLSDVSDTWKDDYVDIAFSSPREAEVQPQHNAHPRRGCVNYT